MMDLPLFPGPIDADAFPNMIEGQAYHDSARLLVKLQFDGCSDFEVAYPWCYEIDQINEGTIVAQDAEWIWCYSQANRDVKIEDSVVLGWYPLPAPNYNEGLPTVIEDPEPKEPSPKVT
jgi:hypothetical protein